MLKNYPKTRVVMYLLAVGAAVAAPLIAVAAPEFGGAVAAAAGVLQGAAAGTAITNISPDPDDEPIG